MKWTSDKILRVLDQCTKDFTFPMLDNGYVYLAAARMSLYRSFENWALVLEVFGFSPRAGVPDIHIYTFASHLHNRDQKSNYVSDQAYENYLKNNPNNEMRFFYPIDNDDWINKDDPEFMGSGICLIRGVEISQPDIALYQNYGIVLEEDRLQIFEFCRYLAVEYRSLILANQNERRVSVLPEMEMILELDEWHHPNIVVGELPSQNEAFQMIAKVLETGNILLYKPTLEPNTHWTHWPEGGTL